MKDACYSMAPSQETIVFSLLYGCMVVAKWLWLHAPLQTLNTIPSSLCETSARYSSSPAHYAPVTSSLGTGKYL